MDAAEIDQGRLRFKVPKHAGEAIKAFALIGTGQEKMVARSGNRGFEHQPYSIGLGKGLHRWCPHR
ncbi:MAG: hypothetical protein J7562_03925 [Agrobacterium tumefaciens]|nr:hypothetical protein [Agrobacterium tumefaciens]